MANLAIVVALVIAKEESMPVTATVSVAEARNNFSRRKGGLDG